NMALAAIGQQYAVSRVSIFENHKDGRTTRNLYEWCNEGISAELENMQQLELFSGNTSIMDCFDGNGLLYCNDVRELPPYVRDIFERQHVLATLQLTIATCDGCGRQSKLKNCPIFPKCLVCSCLRKKRRMRWGSFSHKKRRKMVVCRRGEAHENQSDRTAGLRLFIPAYWKHWVGAPHFAHHAFCACVRRLLCRLQPAPVPKAAAQSIFR
ncbi:MAG: hypothetical protein RSA65_03730, partial [Clostridia bacterium]